MVRKKTTLLGAGNFGRVHANDLANLSVLVGIVDTDPSKKEIADKYGVPFFDTDLTQYVVDSGGRRVVKSLSEAREFEKEGERQLRIALESYDSANEASFFDKYYSKAPEIYEKFKSGKLQDIPEGLNEVLNKTDAIDIATNTPSHYPLMLFGLAEKKDVFVEKPPAEKVDELEHILFFYPEAKIGVDYIEMAHPVVQATKDDMDFEPKYSYNRRSKDLRSVVERGIGGGEGSRIILEDLVHDLSEVDLFRKHAYGKSFAEVYPEVVDAEIQCWYELPERKDGKPKYPYSTDVRAKFRLKFPDGMVSEIEGGFADPEIRQYVLVDEEGKTAEYGNTLTRPNISPIAARVEGKKNVEYLLERVKRHVITDQEKQEKVLKRAGAETLEEKMNKYVPEAKWV
ncbi:Gfo/Idh/MocA family oxidoreductase, partial [bacterium]|nr:Gfo/Idh/MocA family oxidoreductase [bacterium]